MKRSSPHWVAPHFFEACLEEFPRAFSRKGTPVAEHGNRAHGWHIRYYAMPFSGVFLGARHFFSLASVWKTALCTGI